MSVLFFAFGLPAAPEWIFIGILALILFGPKKLPELARGFARIIAEFQHAKEEFQREILQIPAPPKIQEPQEKKLYQASSGIPTATEISDKEK